MKSLLKRLVAVFSIAILMSLGAPPAPVLADGGPSFGDCTKTICVTIAGFGTYCFEIPWVCDEWPPPGCDPEYCY